MVVKKKEKKFAEGYCFKKIFIFFLIGCLIGTYYEEILHFIKTSNWESRGGLIYGPFSPIYGLGVAVFVILLGKNNELGVLRSMRLVLSQNMFLGFAFGIIQKDF